MKIDIEPEQFADEIVGDHKLFRYGADKRPTLPHEQEEVGFTTILTDRGEKKARKLFAEMFPGYDFEKDSGLIWD